MQRLPANIPARGLSLEQVAEYVGVTKQIYTGLVKQGLFPGPLPGGSYDRAAIDAALDRLSGLAKPSSIDWEKVAREDPPHAGRREVRHASR